jgi:hypothetical protein
MTGGNRNGPPSGSKRDVESEKSGGEGVHERGALNKPS